MRVVTGAATRVRSKDPTKSPGRFPNPNEIAPSSRNGRTTKYALKIKKKEEVEWINAEVSWGLTVTNHEMIGSIRALSINIDCIRDFQKMGKLKFKKSWRKKKIG